MFHIITIQSRIKFLEEIYRTIPQNDDIMWHIAKSRHTAPLKGNFCTDKRVKIYEVDCLDSDPVGKINHVFDHISEGFFFVLDDDTIFLESAYKVYKKYCVGTFKGMVVGQQKYANNAFLFRNRCKISADPGVSAVDTGMVICHHSILEHLRWKTEKYYGDDQRFWSACYAHFGQAKVIRAKEVISYYNFFETKVKVRKKIGSLKITWDINNPILVKGYFALSVLPRIIRRLTKKKQLNNFPNRQYTDIFK